MAVDLSPPPLSPKGRGDHFSLTLWEKDGVRVALGYESATRLLPMAREACRGTHESYSVHGE